MGAVATRTATPCPPTTTHPTWSDPPRTGAGPAVCEHLAALRPDTIVYVACDPAALARDARVLAEHGYRLREAVPLDLFPMTHHVEVVATFTT